MTLKIHLLSDLHVEHAAYLPAAVKCDYVVLAGDILSGGKVVEWIADHFPKQEVIYIPGNHCFYHHSLTIDELKAQYKKQCANYAIRSLIYPEDHILVEKGGKKYCIMGGTLWTDYSWSPAGRPIASQSMRMTIAKSFNDYMWILKDDRRITPMDLLQEHKDTLAGMEKIYQKYAETHEFIVCTHMLPSEQSTTDRWRQDPSTTAFCSKLENWILDRPKINLWCHGHAHSSADYFVGECRVKLNPRGYSNGKANENKTFDPTLIIEV